MNPDAEIGVTWKERKEFSLYNHPLWLFLHFGYCAYHPETRMCLKGLSDRVVCGRSHIPLGVKVFEERTCWNEESETGYEFSRRLMKEKLLAGDLDDFGPLDFDDKLGKFSRIDRDILDHTFGMDGKRQFLLSELARLIPFH